MNHGLGTHNALLKEASRRNRRERNNEASAKILAVCVFVMVAYVVAAFVQQVMA